MTHLSRRTALHLMAAGILGVATSGRAARAQDLKPVKVALDWTPNTNHVGLFVAREKGFYDKAGLDVEILPFTDTSAVTLVNSGLAQFGVGGVGFYSQRAAGAAIKAVFAVVQHETGRVVFKAEREDIQRPRDLDGKTYGGFGSAWENALIGSMIRHDGGKGEFETVTLGTSAYQALANGAVDFTLEVETWEGVQAKLAGDRQRAFRYADYGVPDQHTAMLVGSEEFLDAQPETARVFLAATQAGYAFAADNPKEAAGLLVAANPDALPNRELAEASMQALVDGRYLRGETGAVGVLDLGKIAAIGEYLFLNKILKDAGGKALETRPDFALYATNDFLPEG
ncbi:MAG: ABC transporter substrate-binding protein [Methylobacterium mesophilicum]|nr:ABC transporter substrate-binding protein [Methylobacterium mesophilicum]